MLSRRHFLRMNLAAGAAGFSLSHPFLFNRQVLAANTTPSTKRLIFIFQRGGNDGVNTIIPRGDRAYNEKTRPTLHIAEEDALDLGNGFAQAHPRLRPMMGMYDGGKGSLAMLHRIGYAEQSRSHFDSQNFWEHGVPGDAALKEGMFFRHLVETMDLTDPANSFVAASVASTQLLALRGESPFPSFKAAKRFRLQGSEDLANKTLGRESTEGVLRASGVLGLYASDPQVAGEGRKLYTDLVQSTGQALGATLKKVQDAARLGYEASNGASYPDGDFGEKLQEVAMLIKRTDVKILGLNIGGWDTHADQGQANGAHGDRLGEVAQGFEALHLDLQDEWDDVLVVTMTEFGRTSRENAGKGTDHAEASVMFVAGGGVKGGVYNCDPTRWKEDDLFSENERYLARKTDFRAVFGEIFRRHFGDDEATVERVIPGYGAGALANPSDFQRLGFMV